MLFFLVLSAGNAPSVLALKGPRAYFYTKRAFYYCKYRNLYFNYQIYLYKYIDKSIYCQGKSTQMSTYIPLFMPFLLRQPHCHNLLTYKSHLFGVWQRPHNLPWRNQDWSKPMELSNLPHSLPYRHNSYWC